MAKTVARSTTKIAAISTFALLALPVGGVTVLLVFWTQFLRADDLGKASLPLVAFIAGVAATFNPCGLPTLPGFLALMGEDAQGSKLRRRASMSLGASLGAMTLVAILGIIVAIVGGGTKGLIEPYFRWVQMGVGIFLVTLAFMHIFDKTANMPLVGPVMKVGGLMWNHAIGKPTMKGSYIFGGGFVLVGVG